MLLITLAATGICVSELKYVTLESLLGHQDINKTRIYIRLSSKAVALQLSAMKLVA